MAGRQPEEPPRGPFVCEFCAEVWPSSLALAGHTKAHIIKGKAPAAEPEAPFPAVPPGFGAGPRTMPVMRVPPSFALQPPPPAVTALGLGQPVAPAVVPRAAEALLYGGLLRRPLPEQVRVPLPPAAPPPRDPVVFSDAGGAIRMVLLEPNHAFWAPYRMGMDPPEELDFMGLRPRPESPSPSFVSWLDA